jgi:uncharacterized cupredoxin-like copper-binding protein
LRLLKIRSIPRRSGFDKCPGEGEDDDFGAGEPGNPKMPSQTVEVTMSEDNGSMAYAPAEVDVSKGEQIKFIIKNAGTLKHEFHLDTFDDNAHHKIEMQKNPEMEHDIRTRRASSRASKLKFSKAGPSSSRA